MSEIPNVSEKVDAITMVTTGIHNPNNPKHFMRLKPCSRVVRVWLGDKLLAESNNATRLLEVGADIYDPVFYFPKEALCVDLKQIEDKVTHCPLKGDASYYQVEGIEQAGDSYFAWSYDNPFEFAYQLKGLVAFNADFVRVEEVGGAERLSA